MSRPLTARDCGCTEEQFTLLKRIGAGIIANGDRPYKTPIVAFQRHRNLAKFRGIGFELTIWEWWTIWQESGRWDQRGRGHGYMMCRKGDVGPYAVGNVFIATGAHNVSTGPARKSDRLPRGVGQTSAHTFNAQICINGKRRHLGSFPTPELAGQAYQAALDASRRFPLSNYGGRA